MEVKTTYTIQGAQLTLEDLRKLCSATLDLPGSTRIKVTHYSDQRDGTNTTLSVEG